jgi:hypothetical protein
VVADYLKLQDELDQKQEIAHEMTQDASNELSRSLALQTANYLEGVWEVTGKEKEGIAEVVEARKLDYELLERWIKYMAKPTDKYKYKDAWQAMIKKDGGTKAEAKKLAQQFQDEIEQVMLQKNDLDAQNKVLEDKDLDGTKPKKRTDKPSNFRFEQGLQPGALIRFKVLPDDVTNFWVEIFERELRDSEDPQANMEKKPKPGVLLFRGWGLESRLGPETQARLKSIQDDIAALQKKLEPSYPFIHGVKDAEKPVNINWLFAGIRKRWGRKCRGIF